MRPLANLAFWLALATLFLYIVAISSSSWVEDQSSGVQTYHGAFRGCVQSYASPGINDCRHVANDCTMGFADPIGTQGMLSSCHKIRAVRAFTIFALLFTAASMLLYYLAAHAASDFYRWPAGVSGLMAGICGVIAWAIWMSVGYDYGIPFDFGWGYGLLTAGWVTNFAYSFLLTPFELLRPTKEQTNAGTTSYVGRRLGARREEPFQWTKPSTWLNEPAMGGPRGVGARKTSREQEYAKEHRGAGPTTTGMTGMGAAGAPAAGMHAGEAEAARPSYAAGPETGAGYPQTTAGPSGVSSHPGYEHPQHAARPLGAGEEQHRPGMIESAMERLTGPTSSEHPGMMARMLGTHHPTTAGPTGTERV